MSEHEITSITDLLKLDKAQFIRMLPDLCAWWEFAKKVEDLDHASFIWVDDGISGVVKFAELVNPDTGEVVQIGFDDDEPLTGDASMGCREGPAGESD
jgi:hypothetical protein